MAKQLSLGFSDGMGMLIVTNFRKKCPKNRYLRKSCVEQRDLFGQVVWGYNRLVNVVGMVNIGVWIKATTNLSVVGPM